MPDPLHLVLLVGLGAALGLLGGLFGIGGGLVAIPVLGVFFHLDQQHAQGTALAMVVPNVMIGLRGYARRGSLDARVAIVLALCAVAFTFAGALYATRLAGPELRWWFAAFIAVVGAFFAFGGDRALEASGEARARLRGSLPGIAVLGALGGIVSGIFSVGGAIFAVPFLASVFGYTQPEAQGLSLALVAPGTIVGLLAYAAAGDVDWWIGIPLALGGALCVRYGVALAHRLPHRTLRVLFAGFLFASAIALAVHG